jgi:hypothetical protein
MKPTPENAWTLPELLDACGNCQSPARWESGWREFLRRYQPFLLNCIARNCSAWNMPRLKRQHPEVVCDIISDVIYILCKDQCESIRGFTAREQEPVFRAWLSTVSRRATGRYIQKNFSERVADGDFDDMKSYLLHLPFDERWELRESVVAALRSAAGDRPRNAERDILLFQLYVLADFPLATIQKLPCFLRIGHRVVDNVTHRLRSRLRESRQSEILEI